MLDSSSISYATVPHAISTTLRCSMSMSHGICDRDRQGALRQIHTGYRIANSIKCARLATLPESAQLRILKRRWKQRRCLGLHTIRLTGLRLWR